MTSKCKYCRMIEDGKNIIVNVKLCSCKKCKTCGVLEYKGYEYRHSEWCNKFQPEDERCKIIKVENEQHIWRQYCETHNKEFHTFLDNPKSCPSCSPEEKSHGKVLSPPSGDQSPQAVSGIRDASLPTGAPSPEGTFNLSDKIFEIDNWNKGVLDKHVKEFIRRLKEVDIWKDGRTGFMCINKKDFNKLAGPKLIKLEGGKENER